MPSKDIVSIILFMSIATIPILKAEVDCKGHELSAYSNADLEKITEKQCTTVKGDIELKNIDKPIKKSCFLTIQKLEGSLIIENTKDLLYWVNLQNLVTIKSGEKPAVIIKKNENLHLGLGAKLREVKSSNENTFVFLENTNSVIDHNTFNILRYTSSSPTFLIDAFIDVQSCSAPFYMTLTMLIAFLAFTIGGGLVILITYGRKVEKLF